MRTRLEIANFRGVRQGALEDLAPLSVLVGANNSGKSTALEALWFNASRGDAEVAAQIATRRGWCGLGCLQQLLYDPRAEASITAVSDMQRRSVALRINEELKRRAHSIASGGDSSRSPIPPPADPYTFVAVETITRFGQLEDAYYFAGDGYKRLRYIACALAGHSGGLVLLEEPECFQHPTHIREIAQLIWGAIGQGTQVVISTHSLDLLRHLFYLEEAQLDRAAVFHNALRDGVLSAVRIPGERARERMEDLGEDLRQ